MDVPPEVLAAKNETETFLLGLPGVVGVGVGLREENGEIFDELAIRVLVDDAERLPEELPTELAGVGVCVIETQIRACSIPDVVRHDELLGGIRILQPSQPFGIGTLGALVKDNETGELLGLTCFHVTGIPFQSFPDVIWQPDHPPFTGGAVDPNDALGRVVRVDFPQTVPLPGSPVLVGMTDSAVFSLDNARVPAAGRTFSRAIAGDDTLLPNLTDAITATAGPDAKAFVVKRGFQTGVRHGIVLDAHLRCAWAPGGPNTHLVDQIEILGRDGAIFAEDGDSGSLVVVDGEPSTAVGLLWGMSQKSRTSQLAPGRKGYLSPIAAVEAKLGISVVA
ncbi:hypothetical protein AB0M80_21830 [Amycolatopsis sp. NPDC051045]|uniref:hypothetical protein n=1 Tax=Amycolatopsis sp. NPDC051045 TaxID=3156922 RepID=UPI00343ED94E